MLQAMRKYTKSWISSVFLGGLAVLFAIWGIGDIFRGAPDTTAYSVGSTDVPIQEFSRSYQNQMRQLGAAVLPPDKAKAMAQDILDHMALTTALDNLAGGLGLTASQARIGQEIHAVPEFNGPLGTFDHDAFLNAINTAGYSEPEYIEYTRRILARDQLLHAVQDGFLMPADYARAIYSFLRETRAAEYIVLTPAQLGAIQPPADSVLAAYVKAHPERFSTPEYRAVGVAYADVNEIAATIPVTDKQIQDELAANRADYVTDEKREIEQLNFKTEADAKAAKAEIDGGKSFEAVAAERNVQPKEYQLGEFTRAEFSIDPERANAAFALAANGTSAPVKGSFGWSLVHVGKITPGTSKTTDEIKSVVQKKIARGKIVDMANAFQTATDGGDSIDVAARKSGLHYDQIAAIDAQGLGPDGKKATTIDSPEFLAAVAKGEIGEDGDPFTTKDQRYFLVLRVEGVTPPKLKPFDAVRADATQAWLADQRQTLLRDKAKALAAQATTARTLAPAAKALGLPVQSSPALTRDTNQGLFDPALVLALFKAPAGSAVAVPTKGGFIVARVTGIAHPPPAMNDLQFFQAANALSGAMGSDFILSLAKATQQDQGYTVNQKLIDTSLNQGAGQGQ